MTRLWGNTLWQVDSATDYFSGVIAHDNNDNRKALKFFQTSRILIDQHETYLKKYFYSLVLEGKVQFATNEIKQKKVFDDLFHTVLQSLLPDNNAKLRKCKEVTGPRVLIWQLHWTHRMQS